MMNNNSQEYDFSMEYLLLRCNEPFHFCSEDKVCSINFERPDIDLCSACHIYPISGGASIISILFIVNRFTSGLNQII